MEPLIFCQGAPNVVDLELLKTFLEVHRTRHFGRASRSLFITQSAISTRIKQLEETLGVTLFTRKRNDIQLTPAGRRFLASAEGLLGLWEEARKRVLQEEERPALNMGALPGLWDAWLGERLEGLRQGCPGMALHTESHGNDALLRGVLEKRLDVVFLFDPPKSVELQVREVGEVEVMMVASDRDLPLGEVFDHPRLPYILVDWGRHFLTTHARAHPRAPRPWLQTDSASLARDWLLRSGGIACLARSRVARALLAGRLFAVLDGFKGHVRVYAVHLEAPEKRFQVEEALSFLSGSQAGGKG
ncbi:MAG: LysR family transcriptional regulator [Magnetococcales bacterium]|nr:LysR family transcriptional regulator [Magnetococcales bacterium]